MTTPMEELRVLKTTEELVDWIWREVITWNQFTRDTVGKQLARAADSIGANIAEAYGRFHYGEKINLLYYARGSLFETKYWLNRCKTRQLISPANSDMWTQRLGDIGRQINSFASSLKTQRGSKNEKTLRESDAEYLVTVEIQDVIFDEQELNWVLTNDTSIEPPFRIQTLISNLQSPISDMDSL